MITERQTQLLTAILREYVETAEPVSSGFLAKHADEQVSPATIRNELAALEDAGYLTQPHTSAGRIPTEKAWRWYVQNLMQTEAVAKGTRENVQEVIRTYRHTHAEMLRRLAKKLAALAGETVVLAPAPNETYYTGLSNLFAQPEFEHVSMVQNMSRVIDRFDDVMGQMFDRLEEDVLVLVGKDNPFSADCGTVMAKYRLPHSHHGLIGILGPLRQNYDEHVAMIRFATDELNRETE